MRAGSRFARRDGRRNDARADPGVRAQPLRLNARRARLAPAVAQPACRCGRRRGRRPTAPACGNGPAGARLSHRGMVRLAAVRRAPAAPIPASR
ncbi:hypothetical protein BLAT2472_40072 [Burkholderia latens]